MQANKFFVKAMMITAISALVILVAAMALGLNHFLAEAKAPGAGSDILSQEDDVQVANVVGYTGVVQQLTEEQVLLYDIKGNKVLVMNLNKTIQVLDKVGKAMPLSEIAVGDIVAVQYDVERKQVLEMGLVPESWVKTTTKELVLNQETHEITIGSSTYRYTDFTTIMGLDHELISMDEVGIYDKLELRGIGEEIYSIKIQERQGYIQLENLPILDGILEIDINRQIPIMQIVESIPVSAGKHNVTIELKGYQPVTHTLEVKPEEVTTLSLEGATMVYGRLEVQVLNGISNYEVKVGTKKFHAGDVIEVLEGQYDVIVVAPGYKPWGKKVQIKDHMVLQVTLQEEQKAEEPEEKAEEVPKVQDQKEETSVEEYDINIASEPSEATVYINGKKQGVTPLKTKLKIGDYSIVLEKEGYEYYSTSIIIDNSDNQHSYLYALKSKNEDN